MSHVNKVVGDDPESHLSLHSIGPVVAATCQSVPSLDHADPAFASRPPLRLNQRCFSSLRRSSLRALRLGSETCFTPRACAPSSFARE